MPKKDSGGSAPTSLWNSPIIWCSVALLVSIKCSLLRCYHSTDFEVHRNWMAITHHLPLREWYRSNVSQWTLDYPPLFAYFEWLLSQAAANVEPAMLKVQAEPYFSERTLLFQRLSVIASDVIYVFGAIHLSDALVESVGDGGPNFRRRLKHALCLLLLFNPALILLDNVHFQYNSFLYGLLLFALAAVCTDRPLTGAFLFSVLLNFKHLNLYYVPTLVAHYFLAYLLPLDGWRFIRRGICLGVAVALPLLAAFGPFVVAEGIPALEQIASRLFPFKRGLSHAYWAPNFWALYNTADLALYRLMTLARIECNPEWMRCPLNVPLYTRGLVTDDTRHSLLPEITPGISLAMVVVALSPILMMMLSRSHRHHNTPSERFLIHLSLSAFAFFVFGWHVHEKAALMMLMPISVLTMLNPLYLPVHTPLCLGTLSSLFPLLYTPMEQLVKYTLVGAYVCALMPALFYYSYGLGVGQLGIGWLYPAALFLLEIYKQALHPLIFGEAVQQFLPLMATSVLCFIGVLWAYARLLSMTIGGGAALRWWEIKKCISNEVRRNLIKIGA